ncbi:unnamed protein product [Caenorhabditis sp. 36 PRJEB53466]|nr:unnamed protein product [Caenorhabditis sp. 36 PRJEB53466]
MFTDFRYRPGDVLMVRPYNMKETIEIAIEALGFSEELLDRPVKVMKNYEFIKSPPYYLLGNITTLRICLERYFDLQQVPKRSFFEMLSYFSKDPAEKERLSELASSEGIDDLYDYARRSRRTSAEALRDFPNTAKNLNPDQLFEILPTIRPRAFSIASAPNMSNVELLVAKVEYSTRLTDKRRGLCSTFISRLAPGEKVFCKIRSGTFKFPSPQQPIICIGPGTGVAPFRSLFVERSQLVAEENSLLFFGCRKQRSDFYFRDEWEKLYGVEVVTAFSRDSEKKIYVQHKIEERAKQFKRLLELGAPIFVAGSSGDMPKAVINVIKEINGEEWTKKAEETGRIQLETWS